MEFNLQKMIHGFYDFFLVLNPYMWAVGMNHYHINLVPQTDSHENCQSSAF